MISLAASARSGPPGDRVSSGAALQIGLGGRSVDGGSMAQDFTQDERLISVGTPLGKDYFLLTGISGHEAVSQLFEFDLEMLGGDDTVDDKKLVGENVTFSIKPRGGERSF